MPYSGISDSKLPDYIKKLSKRLRKIWVAAFNSAFHSFNPKKHKAPNAEAFAFAVANAAVKKAKKSKKESVELPAYAPDIYRDEDEGGIELCENLIKGFEVLEDYSFPDRQVNTNFVISLKEAEIDEENKTAIITVIRRGWSKNKRYYSSKVLEAMPELLLERPKIFADHVAKAPLGRSVKEWACNIEEAWLTKDKSAVKAKVRFTENPMTIWLWEEAKKNPSNVQYSIDAFARAHEGEKDGTKGLIIDEFVGLSSLDLVSYASAGGVTDRVVASEISNDLDIIEETAKTIKEAMDVSLTDLYTKKAERSKIEALLYTFIDLLYNVSWSYGKDQIEEKRKKIKQYVDEFLTEFKKLDVIKAFESQKPKQEDNMEKLTKQELAEKYPDLLKAIESEAVENYKAELDKTDKEKEFEEKIQALETKVSELTESLGEKEKELESYKAREAREKKEASLKTKIKEVKLDESKIPESFFEVLMEKEEKDWDKLLEDFASLLKPATTTVDDNGDRGKSKGKKDGVDKSLAEDDELAAKKLSGLI